MSRFMGLMLFSVVAACTACSGSSDEALKTADALKSAAGSGASSSASDNPVCKLFSSGDAERYTGESTRAGEPSIGGCQWDAADGTGYMNVQIVGARYHEKPKQAPGYRTLSDVTGEAFVATDMGGWTAGAIAGKDAIRVSTTGDGASEASTIALLKDAIKRHGESHAE